jgi:hypothetical protein
MRQKENRQVIYVNIFVEEIAGALAVQNRYTHSHEVGNSSEMRISLLCC